MSHIFISYSKNDIAFARHLCRLLEAEGFSVWMDETRLVPAERWWPTIESNIRSCAAFIVIMSAHSKQSVGVEREILVAEEEDVKKPIFPILLAGKRWARLAEKQYEDMTGGVNAALSPRLIGGLAQYAPRTREPAPPPLPGSLLETGQQPIAALVIPEQIARRVPTLVWGVALVAVIGLAGLLGLNGGFDSSGEIPTLTATLSQTDEAATVNALMLAIQTEDAATLTRAVEQTSISATAQVQATFNAQATRDQLATLDALGTANALTATATWWTPIPTPDYRLTAEAQLSGEQMATRIGQAPPRVTSNMQWVPVEREFSGVTMVRVPVGCFDMGSDEDGQRDERPVHRQCFDETFWIDKYEVTNSQYLRVTGRMSPSRWQESERPVEQVSWFEARDFCTLRDARLPTEREWEYAARGPDNLIYPWGDLFVADNAIYGGNSNYQTARVGSRPQGASWVGALDMSGNVWEWVSSIHLPHPYDAGDGREDLDRIGVRVLRGGSWPDDGSTFQRAPLRAGLNPDSTSHNYGFRCARDYQDGDLGNQ